MELLPPQLAPMTRCCCWFLATNCLDDPIDASPAIVGKELYLRGQRRLYCLAE